MKPYLILVYFIVLSFISWRIVSFSNEKQQISYEQAEINSIKYGLFDTNQWKSKIADIIVKKIDEYSLTPENKEYIKSNIELGFIKLIEELALFLEQEKTKGNWFEKILKTLTYGVIFDRKELEKQVPKWADEVMKIIDTSAEDELKEHFKSRILNLMNDSYVINENVLLNNILLKYSFNKKEREECSLYLDRIKSNVKYKILIWSFTLIVFCLLPYLVVYVSDEILEYLIFYKVVSLIFLLYLALSVQMLVIDVRIDYFHFTVLSEKISFQNQTLYFQSKSILEVVKLLILSSSANALLTGIVILCFSILFPLTKLLFLLYESITGIKTIVSDFFVNKSSKWSMADVMVVSILLSFLGINSLIDDMMELTSSSSSAIQAIPNTNHSNLDIGVVFFIIFVLLSLLTKSTHIQDSKSLFGKTF